MWRNFILGVSIVLCLSSEVKAAPDTVFFNQDWKITASSDYSFYRILNVKEKVVSIIDHYNNGVIHMIGTIVNSEEGIEKAKSSHELDGFEVGEFSWCFPNGIMYLSIDYDPELNDLDSTLLTSVNYSTLKYEKKYYINGKVKEEGYITSNGKSHGKHIEYYEHGTISTETTYDNGVIIGTKYTYGYDGAISSETEYVNGEKHGTQKLYDYLGRLKSTRTYENGKLIKEKKAYLSFTKVK